MLLYFQHAAAHELLDKFRDVAKAQPAPRRDRAQARIGSAPVTTRIGGDGQQHTKFAPAELDPAP